VARLHAPVPSVKFFQHYVSDLISLKLSVQTSTSDVVDTSIPLEAPPDPAATVAEVPLATAPAIASGTSATGAATATALAPEQGRPAAIWNRLAALLDQQLLDASRIAGPVGLEFHREAVYVMAALTDEIFVRLTWEGRDYWLAHLFEARFFRSHFAGQRFFTRIDELLTRDDDAAAETATVYLMALALGFRGRYYGQNNDAILDGYRNRLFFFVARRDPGVAESVKRLFPETYRFTIQGGAPRKLPAPRRWVFILGAAVVVWVAVAEGAWMNLTGELIRKVCCPGTPACRLECLTKPPTKGGS
jgi:type VI secretion system protein ImpK